MTNKQKIDIFEMCYPKVEDKIKYWERRAKEQLKKDGYYSKKYHYYERKANALRLSITTK